MTDVYNKPEDMGDHDELKHLVPAEPGTNARYRYATREEAQHYEPYQTLHEVEIEASFDDVLSALGVYRLLIDTAKAGALGGVEVSFTLRLGEVKTENLAAIDALTETSWSVSYVKRKASHVYYRKPLPRRN